MCLARLNRFVPPAMVRLRRCGRVAAPLLALAGCGTLFDKPIEPLLAEQAEQALKTVVHESIDALAQQGKERVSDALSASQQAGQRVIMFPKPGGEVGISERGWPVMHIEQVAAHKPPQLVLQGPVRGVVFLDEREMGLVHEDSVRIVTLAPGEHHIRIVHPLMPPMQAQFYIDAGERITLRWEVR